ncbi:uncharacterized protein At5g08430-like isoform X2 [Asparagus officinalis]|uniref:uncharacterized protein At5g08430-like isoform X2 n=1 Tax=Asparagus officinalis TaxID=4686 RepID=UPI00098E49A7|nr:uncharacterized protein At5g08430-like isoform X2 [Asparagus officinalis]
MKKDQWKEDEISEDYCFICKDGGLLRVCDFKKCLKAYHPNCVDKDESFLGDDESWTCGWHSCNCGDISSFHCFCCPTSYCQSCVKSAEFVQVKKSKGFCINCLRLARMIEEDETVDSDGEKVDFSNTETYEFLFKDYWEIVKDQEGLTIVDVQAADALLKRGENLQNESDNDKPYDEESMSGPDDLENYCDDGKSLFKGLKGKRGRKKSQVRKPKKERAFIGWASVELNKFLTSIGKNATKPLNQIDVTEIIKDYAQSKNLFPPNKKRRNLVIPDENLHSLFRKKKLKYHKIFDLVKSHLAEEQSDASDEFSLSSQEDGGTTFAKKRRCTNSDYKTPRLEINHCRKKDLEPSRSCYAAIVVDNIKLAYLKRSLMLELLQNPETFEVKVVGCFVRVKNDPKDFYFMVQKTYQLGQVTGIKKTEQTYKIGETSTDIVLCISNFSKDVKISLLSDDNIEEEDCEDLRQLVKKGLFKRPTIVELEKKVKSIHEDIVNHWISREILKLQKQIERANEKGWRRELHEYIDRRELLRTPEERTRLVKEIPEIIPDTGNDVAYVEGAAEEPTDVKGNSSVALGNDGQREAEDVKGNSAVILENDAERKAEGIVDSSMQRPLILESELKSKITEDPVSDIKGAERKHPWDSKTSEIEIIALDDDDDEENMEHAFKGSELTSKGATIESNDALWLYKDPSGNKQGPFTLSLLRSWRERGYFTDTFKIWKSDQCEEDALLLTVVLASANSGS